MKIQQNHYLSLNTLFPIRCLIVTLQFRRLTHIRLFHQPALSAFLRYLAGSPDNFDQHVRIDVPESGRITYQVGDYYRFMLVGLGDDSPILATLFEKLQRLPISTPRYGKKLPFSDNLVFVQIQDALTEKPLRFYSQASGYDQETLQQEVALWQNETVLHWQFLSPARLLKDKSQRERENLKGEMRFGHDATDFTGELLLQRIHNSIADLLRRRAKIKTSPAIPPDFALQDVHVFWLDCAYTDQKGNHKVMGGVSGCFRMQLPANLSPAWWELLILGQYIGIGQRTSFGWGRYQLKTEAGTFSYRHPLPASSMLMLAQNEENLTRAWQKMTVIWQQQTAPIASLRQALKVLLEGTYHQYQHDQVLQQAVLQVIEPALMQLLSHYRQPRLNEKVIQAFFARDIEEIKVRLNALFYGDPVVNCIVNWLK